MDDSSNQNNFRPLQADKCFVNFNIIIYSLHVSFLGYTKQIFTLQILVLEWTLSKLYYYVLYTHTLMSTTRPLLILYSLCDWWYVSSLFKEQINYDTGICYDNVHTAVYSWLIVYSRYRSTTCSDPVGIVDWRDVLFVSACLDLVFSFNNSQQNSNTLKE